MATVKISQAHTLPVEEAKKRLSESFATYTSKFGVKLNWEGDKLLLKGSGFEGVANVSGSSVDVEVKLGLMVSAFKGKVEEGIRTELQRTLKG